MRFEIIEYTRDETGKEVVSDTYEITDYDFYRIMEQLDAAVQNGAISSYAYTPV